ncbi:MAG: serine hydrolase [Gemmatimonadales bacterium]
MHIPLIGLVGLAVFAPAASAQTPYYPTRSEWATRTARDAGMDSLALAAAVAFAQQHENRFLRDLDSQLVLNTAREPYPAIEGPVRDRGGPAGLIIRHGYIVAQWGDVERVDMTFSVAKSYVSAIAGLAFDRGMIRDIHDPVSPYVRDDGYTSPHNAVITWHQMLNQTNEWEGTLWGKPDVADRRRGRDRTLQAPGTFYEYNDVRVNRTAYNLLQVWRRPLPEVLRDLVMRPIGASDTWEWHGYSTSWTEMDGRRVQSVSGGGHWGGGVWASTLDHARFGLLFLRRGLWGNARILSEAWITMATTPTDIMPTYGYMWWLNPEQRMYSNAPATAFFARGAGGNIIWVDPEHDLVVVTRWLDDRSVNEFVGLVLGAVVEE